MIKRTGDYHVSRTGRFPRVVVLRGARFGVPDLVVAGYVVVSARHLQGFLAKILRGLLSDEPPEGSFELGPIDASWLSAGPFGELEVREGALQAHEVQPLARGLDTPDMTQELRRDRADVWAMAASEPLCWPWPFPEDSLVATSRQVLLGEPVTEVGHWLDGEWQALGPSDLTDNNVVWVPLAVLAFADESLLQVLQSEPGTYAERSGQSAAWTFSSAL